MSPLWSLAWRRTGFPVLTVHYLRDNVNQFVEQYIKLSKSEKKSGAGYEASRKKFSIKLEGNKLQYSYLCQYKTII